jgi:hypothetical protein
MCNPSKYKTRFEKYGFLLQVRHGEDIFSVRGARPTSPIAQGSDSTQAQWHRQAVSAMFHARAAAFHAMPPCALQPAWSDVNRMPMATT